MDQAAQANLVSQGWRPQVDKEDVATVKGLTPMTEMLDRLTKFANTRSETQAGAYFQGLQANHSPLETQAQNDLAMIKTDIMKAGTTLEGIKGRVLAKQFGVESDALTDPHITRDQAIQRVHNMEQKLQDTVESSTSGMNPQQKDAFLKYNKVQLPQYANSNPQNPAQGHRIVSYDQQKSWYDAQTGKPIGAPQVVPTGQPISTPPPPGMQQGSIVAQPPPGMGQPQ
jgi:hypothetical protein